MASPVSVVVSPNSMLCFVKFILSRLTNDDEKDEENSARLNKWREKELSFQNSGVLKKI